MCLRTKARIIKYKRELFDDSVTNFLKSGSLLIEDYKGRTFHISKILGKLWNCTDIMPSFLCDTIDIPKGSSYACGARSMKRFITKK